MFRDLKLENILYRKDGGIVIIDFGLGFLMKNSRSTSIGRNGTEDYMTLEMLSRKHYDKSVDYWALGFCICEMKRFRPFDVEEVAERRVRIKAIKAGLKLPDDLSADFKVQI